MTELIVDIVREFLDYNPETGVFRWKKRDLRWFEGIYAKRSCKIWNTLYTNTIAGAFDKDGYRLIGIFGKRYKAHRLAWFYVYGEWPQNQLDHINYIKDDNRIENLREATNSQNHMNGSEYVWGKSKFRGVYWNEERSKWQAQIKVNGKTKNLGRFTIEEDAARAYDRAALELFGKYANINFPIKDLTHESHRS